MPKRIPTKRYNAPITRKPRETFMFFVPFPHGLIPVGGL
jgi:hypothetical protein